MREALYALAYCERELYGFRSSNFVEVLDDCMSRHPEYWQKHYTGSEKEIGLKRKYSFSDRCRYCMPDSEVKAAKDLMLDHLKDGVPLNLLSQFMPIQYRKVREGTLENKPEALIKDHIGSVIDDYLYATKQELLFGKGERI